MKSSAKVSDYKDFEIVFPKSAKSKLNTSIFGSGLTKLLQQIISTLTQEPEPRIGQVKDSFGNTIWCVYDPITGQSARLNSEAEVRVWLEERYYHYK